MSKSLQQLLSLKGKTAVVTGGAGYLGTAISETLAELGANLVLASRDKAKCEKKAAREHQLPVASMCRWLGARLLKKGSAPAFIDGVHEHFDSDRHPREQRVVRKQESVGVHLGRGLGI